MDSPTAVTAQYTDNDFGTNADRNPLQNDMAVWPSSVIVF